MKNHTILNGFIILLISIFIISCDSDKKKNEPTTDQQTETQKTTTLEIISETSDLKNEDIVYTWVNNLNIRVAPNKTSEVVTKVSVKQPLIFTGKRSDKSETIVLRGIAYYEPWLQVKIDKNKKGWVFGGAVKRESEEKGNAEITTQKFNFEKFGEFDLSTWKLVKTADTSGEELDATTKTYQKGNQKLTIEEQGMGEFYYGFLYKLMDENGKLLKERDLSFSADEEDFILMESVKDYTISKRYERKQAIDKHFSSLNTKPMMVRGEWEISMIQAEIK